MIRVINADVMAGLSQIDSDSVHCVVTSPPYWGLRDYSVQGQIGLEKTPELYVEKMVQVFREIRRVAASKKSLELASLHGPGKAVWDRSASREKEKK